MATASQHPNVRYVIDPTGQPNVVIQTQSNSQEPQRLHLSKTHKVLGTLQILAGFVCLFMEVIGVCVGPTRRLLYTGFYTGTFFAITGFLGFLGASRNNRNLLKACRVMSIFAACLFCTAGAYMSFAEMHGCIDLPDCSVRIYSRYVELVDSGFVLPIGRLRLQMIKQSLIIAACIFEFLVSILHITCISLSVGCCPSHKRFKTSTATPATVVVPQPNQMDASTPLVIHQRNEVSPLSTRPPSYRESCQQNEAFGDLSDSPPPYDEIVLQ